MKPDFEFVFKNLRKILEPYSARLTVTADTPNHYCLSVDYSPKFKKGYPVAWVKISKAYVGFHFMPIYMFPKLRDSMSDQLCARMQGKSCFNFKQNDEALFSELETITAQGFAMARKAGFVSRTG